MTYSPPAGPVGPRTVLAPRWAVSNPPRDRIHAEISPPVAEASVQPAAFSPSGSRNARTWPHAGTS